MKNIIFLGSLLAFLSGCKQDIQPTNTYSAASRVTNGSSIMGTAEVTQVTSDSIPVTWKPTGFSITAVKLDIDKIVTSSLRNDSLGTDNSSVVTVADTLWKETSTSFSTTSNPNEPFKITNVSSGNYKVIIQTTDSKLSRTLDRVKVSDSFDTNLGIIWF